MKITIEHDDKKTEVFQNVTDAYLAVVQRHDVMDTASQVGFEMRTQSYSWGGRMRDLIKELRQSEVELQNIINKQNNGNS